MWATAQCGHWIMTMAMERRPVSDGAMAHNDCLPERLVGTRAVCRTLDCSDRCLRRWVAAGIFPPPDLKIGRNLRWRVSTVKKFIDRE